MCNSAEKFDVRTLEPKIKCAFTYVCITCICITYRTRFVSYHCIVLTQCLDPMGAIIPRMPRKRQKVSYIDRLLELSVITDKKQCRKKRLKKNAKSGTDNDKSNGMLLNNFNLLYQIK